MNTRHLRNRGAPADIDVNLVGLQYFVVDHNAVRRLKTGVTLDDRTILRSTQPFLNSLIRPAGNSVLAGFHSFHVDAYIAGCESVFRAAAGYMGGVCAGD